MTMRKLDVPHTPVDLTAEQRSNLIKLRDYVAENVKIYEFNMTIRCMDHRLEGLSPISAQRASYADYVGWGPKAGISPDGDRSWLRYMKRFVPYFRCTEEIFLFDMDWPNSIPEAIARTDYLLEHGVPDFGGDYSTQFAPLREKHS